MDNNQMWVGSEVPNPISVRSEWWGRLIFYKALIRSTLLDFYKIFSHCMKVKGVKA